MTIYYINTGSSANRGDGDTLRTAFNKINANFQLIEGNLQSSIPLATGQDGLFLSSNGTDIVWASLPTVNSLTNGLYNVTLSSSGTLNISTGGSITIGGQSLSTARLLVGATAPLTPVTGDLWYDDVSGRTYVWYDTSWVDAAPRGPAGTQLPNENGNAGEFLTTDGSNLSWTAVVPGSFTITNISYFTNDVEYLTSGTINQYVNEFTITDVSYFTNDVEYLTSSTVGQYITSNTNNSWQLTSGTAVVSLASDNTTTFPGDLIPASTGSQFLGSTSTRWDSLFLGAGSVMDIDGFIIKKDAGLTLSSVNPPTFLVDNETGYTNYGVITVNVNLFPEALDSVGGDISGESASGPFVATVLELENLGDPQYWNLKFDNTIEIPPYGSFTVTFPINDWHFSPGGVLSAPGNITPDDNISIHDLGSTQFPWSSLYVNSINGTQYSPWQLTSGTAVLSLSTSGTVTVVGDLLPDADVSYDLGSPTQQWRSLYVSTNTIYINNVPISINTSSNTLQVGGINTTTVTNVATEEFVTSQGYVTGTPWTSEGYVTGTPWTEAGYVTDTPWTQEGYLISSDLLGYVSGTPWRDEGYVTSSSTYAWTTITANKFVGDGSSLTNVTVNVAGNILGTGTNVTLVAGSYSYLFDNTGTFTMPVNGDIVMTGTNSILSVSGTTLLGGYTQVGGYYSTLGISYPGGSTQYGMTLRPAADNTNAITFLNAAGTNIGAITQTTSTVTFTGDGSGLTNLTGVATKTTGNWTLTTGANSVNFSVPGPGTYTLWVNGNIPNGIVTYTANVVVTNQNVPVVGTSYGWYYAAGNALVLTAIPNQIVGTANGISSAVVSTTTAWTFAFGITNNSTGSQTVSYGYTRLG